MQSFYCDGRCLPLEVLVVKVHDDLLAGSDLRQKLVLRDVAKLHRKKGHGTVGSGQRNKYKVPKTTFVEVRSVNDSEIYKVT